MQRQGGHSGHGGEHTGHNGQSRFESIRNKESKIAGASVEHSMAVDSDGNVIPGSEKEGTETSVTFSYEETIAMKGAASFTHNHPDGGSFSGEDFYMAYSLDMGEMRAVTSEGVFIMKPPEGKTWKQSYNMGKMVQIQDRISGRTGLTDANQRQYLARKAEVGKRQANFEFTHDILAKTSTRYGFQYSFEPKE